MEHFKIFMTSAILSKKIFLKSILFLVLLFFVSTTAFSVPFSNTKIGGISIAEAQSVSSGTTAQPSVSVEDKNSPKGLECFKWNEGLRIGDCTALLGYYAFFVPASWILYAGGTIFDTMVALSLSNIDQPFVNDAWKIVRDFANMAFIFVLLYIAIATILNLGNYKKLLVNLVIVALVINFSAFFTKIVIDASNIVALEIHQRIAAPIPEITESRLLSSIVPEKSISAIFMNGFSLQSITGSKAYSDWRDKGESAGSLFFVFLAAGIVSIVAAFTFFAAGFLFLGRMVAFWFLIIASPLAFIAFILPGARSFFSQWWSTLINQALVAPVFLFFMYVIASMVSSNFMSSVFRSGGTDLADITMNIIVSFLVLLITLTMALNVTKKLSGQAGSMATKFAGGATIGAALFTGRRALGTAAFAGRHSIGRAARGLAQSDKVKRTLGKSRMGRTMYGAIDKTASSSFDARNTSVVGKTFGKGGGKGGYNKYATSRINKIQSRVASVSTGRDGKPLYAQVDKKAAGSYHTKDGRRINLASGDKMPKLDDANYIVTNDTGEIQYEKQSEKLAKELLSKPKTLPGKFMRGTRMVTGKDRTERDAALGIREGKTGKKSTLETLKKELKEELKKENTDNNSGNNNP